MEYKQYGNKPLILFRDPVLPMEAATKNYVDNKVSTHENNMSLNLTSDQNTWLDTVVGNVSVTEMGYLTGLTGSVQTQLDGKFDKSGGTISGDVNIASGFSITLSKRPDLPTSVVNKAYVDALISGQEWKDPVTDIMLVADNISTPPVNPIENGVYIIGSNATGSWVGKEGYAAYFKNGSWVYLQSRPVAIGDRFGVALTADVQVSSTLVSYNKQVVTVTGVTNGYTYSTDNLTAGSTTLVFDENSKWFGVSFSYTDEGNWVPTNTSVNLAPGDGLSLNGNILNINLGKGLTVNTNKVTVATLTEGGLWFTEDGLTASTSDTAVLGIKLKDSTLTLDSNGLSISTTVIDDIQDKVSKSGTSTVTGTVTFSETATLKIGYTPVNADQAVPKSYVDNVNSNLQESINNISTDVAGLKTDPVTKTYVDTGLAGKVAKAGDTMTGYLTLVGDPTADKHAATKKYVDDSVLNAQTGINNSLDGKLNLTGGTMTGFISMDTDHLVPLLPTQLTTKKYVDDSVAIVDQRFTTELVAVTTDIDNLTTIVDGLNTDPVTKTYVDTGLAEKVAKAGDTMTGYLTLVGDPTQNKHAATKQYVDNIASGLNLKPAVDYATTTALSVTYVNGNSGVGSILTATSNGRLIVDGQLPDVGDRILVKNQASKIQNGDYVVQQTGDAGTPFMMTRVETVNESSEIPSAYFFVKAGDTLKGTGWVLVVDAPATFRIGTDNIYVNQFSGQGSVIAGNGLTIDGNTLDINSANTGRIVVNANDIDLALTGVTAGTATKLTFDEYGRIVSFDNPTTLEGYGITDAQPLNSTLTKLGNVSGNGITVRNSSGDFVTKELDVAGLGISVTNGNGDQTGKIIVTVDSSSNADVNTLVYRDQAGNFKANTIEAALSGNAASATKLQSTRTFKVIGGDVNTDTVNFDGTNNVTLQATLSDTGITAGWATKVRFDVKGRAVELSTPSDIADIGITNVYTKTEVDNVVTTQVDATETMMYYMLARM